MPGTPLQTRFASIDVTNNEDFFRLFQEVQSSGDIFEVDSGMLQWCVGPNSDLSAYDLFYYDQQLDPDRLNVLEVSVGNPFVARINSLLDRQYPTVGNPAQLLVATRDLVDPDFLPRDYDPVGPPPDLIARFAPRIDLIGMLGTPTGIAPIRANRVFNLNGVISGVAANLWMVFPYYGRRQATVSVTNLSIAPAAVTVNFDLIGVRLGIGATTAAVPQQRHTEIPLTGTPVIVPSQTDRQITTKASDDGQFDLLVVRFADPGLATDRVFMDVTMSDREG